ncbi:MAG TPA: hypothetical protein VM899_04770 [Rubellimicrobium sp.]|jgi:hypothetical protein|nr:hypothetical protein [Rubellimicrobium sp.]
MKKILMLTTVALLGTTGLVAAQETTATENAFGLPEVQEDNLLIALPLVTATADGVVEIRGIAGEQEGQVFASQPVTAGANENVRISLLQAPNAEAVMAVLVIDGADVAMQEIRLDSPGNDDSGGDDQEDGDDEGESGDDSGEGGGGSGATTDGGNG